MREAEGTTVCPFSLKKSRKDWRISAEVMGRKFGRLLRDCKGGLGARRGVLRLSGRGKGAFVGGMSTKTLSLAIGLYFGIGAACGVLAGEDARGTLAFDGSGTERNSMAHWDEYGWEFDVMRPGRYYVEISYHGLRKPMGVQARFRNSGEDRAKDFLKAGGTKDEPRVIRLAGTVFTNLKKGKEEIVLFTPPDDPQYDFKLAGVKLVPAPEGEEIVQAEDGSVTLLAKDATTFAEKMRYEWEEEKNCLGYWIFKDDWAQWEFEVTEGGTFAASIFQGCGGGNHGSTVAVEAGDQKLTFAVEDTGGFQNWKEVSLGELKLEAGTRRLAVRPVDQKAKAVLDIQKIVLKPVK